MTWGAIIAVIALVVAYVALPFAHRWSAREDAISAAGERVARLRGLLAAAPQLGRWASQLQHGDPGRAHVLTGRTVSLIGSELQRVLQDHARASRLSVSRLEVSSDSAATPERGVTASVTATTDIYGLADFLTRLHGSSSLLVTEALTVTPNPVMRGDLLQVAVGVRAPFVLAP